MSLRLTLTVKRLIELAVIIAGVIRITGVQESNLAGKVGSKHTGVVGSKLAGLVLSWLVRVELVEFELVENEVELVPHDDIVLVIGVPADVY